MPNFELFSFFQIQFECCFFHILDVGDSPDKACSIAVIPQNEKNTDDGDSDSDGSDVEYDGGDRPFAILDVECTNEWWKIIVTNLLWLQEQQMSSGHRKDLSQGSGPSVALVLVEQCEVPQGL